MKFINKEDKIDLLAFSLVNLFNICILREQCELNKKDDVEVENIEQTFVDIETIINFQIEIICSIFFNFDSQMKQEFISFFKEEYAEVWDILGGKKELEKLFSRFENETKDVESQEKNLYSSELEDKYIHPAVVV